MEACDGARASGPAGEEGILPVIDAAVFATGAAGPRRPIGRAEPDGSRTETGADGLGDVVVNRLFAVGLDLHLVLGLIEHPEASRRLCAAVADLDQAIRDVRRLMFEHDPPPVRP